MSLEPFSDNNKILNSILTTILIVDNDLKIIYFNTAAQHLLSQSTKKLMGCYFPELFHYLSLDIPLMRQTLSQAQGFTDNEVNLVINGQLYILSCTAQQFNQESILIEMTPLNSHKKLLQEQLQHAQQIAAKELVRNLAHEIKNPLGGLRGAAQLLTRELPNSELQEYTKLIIEQADRLKNLVDRLLGPQQPTKQTKQNIHKAIEQVYTLLCLEKSENITIQRDYDPSLPELNHDAEQIQQVLLNISRNALQALGNSVGTIKIRTRTAFQVTINGKCYRLCAQIDIEDNGPGIPVTLSDTLFYPTVSGREGGSGLGLSIARNIIDQHQGKIEFNSWPGHTKFSIYLPIKQ